MPLPCQAYYTVRERLRPLLTGLSRPQLTNLSLLVFGLLAAGNCQLPRIAVKLPLPVGSASLTQRLRRLLMNDALKPDTLYRPVARLLLSCFTGGAVRLILDATDLGGRLPVLFVALAYRGRALPLAWRMLPAMGCSAFSEQKALLAEVAALVPSSVTVTLLADREYGSLAVTRWCLAHGWHFGFRLKKNRRLTDAAGQRRQIASLAACAGRAAVPLGPPAGGPAGAAPGPVLRLEPGRQGRRAVVHPQRPAQRPARRPPGAGPVPRPVPRRGDVEEMFRDFKEFGFRLETTRLRDKERVSRLLLCVCLAHVWLMNAGAWASKRGLRRRVDRHEVRQLSYFQIGWRFLQHAGACGLPLRCEMAAYN